MTKEEVDYRLDHHGDDEALNSAIVETIGRLPEDVAEFALEHCIFLSVGRAAYGMTLPGRVVTRRSRWKTTRNQWLILLAEDVPDDDLPSFIAHEIAHAWRKDDRLSPDLPDDCETETALLVKSWGFEGRGADPDYCNAPFAGITKPQRPDRRKGPR